MAECELPIAKPNQLKNPEEELKELFSKDYEKSVDLRVSILNYLARVTHNINIWNLK